MSMGTTVNGPAPSRSEAYRVLERIFDEGFATGNDAIVDEICSPDLVEHQFGTAGRGAEAIAQVKASIRDVHGAFPDIAFTIEDSAESGDVIWVRVRGRGTATGPFFGPPSGTAGRLHRHRRGPDRRWPDRRALGGAGPVRRAGPDRRAGPAGVLGQLALGLSTERGRYHHVYCRTAWVG